MNDYRPRQFSLLPTAVKNILIINGIFFLATFVFQSAYHIDLAEYLGLFFPANNHFHVWQFVTYMFMHASIDHIFFNMLSFWMFGSVLENVWGTKRFLLFYFFTGIGAALCNIGANYYTYFHLQQTVADFLNHPSPIALQDLISKNKLIEFSPFLNSNQGVLNSWLNDSANPTLLNDVKSVLGEYQNHLGIADERFAGPMVGASGAVFGVLFAFGYLFPNTMIYVYFFIPLRAKYFVMIYGAIEFFSAWRSVPGDSVAHIAHLGGMLFGFFLIYYWNKTKKQMLF